MPNRLVGANEPAQMPLLMAIAIRTASTPARRAVAMPTGAGGETSLRRSHCRHHAASPKNSTGSAGVPSGAGHDRRHHAIERAIQLGDAEEVGDAGHQDQDGDWEPADHLPQRHACQARAHRAGSDEHQQAEMHAAQVANPKTATKIAIAPMGAGRWVDTTLGAALRWRLERERLASVPDVKRHEVFSSL